MAKHHHPVFGVNALRKILLTRLDEKSQAQLLTLYRDNQSFWTKLGYGVAEIVDDFAGVGVMQALPSPEEMEVYEKLKRGEYVSPEIAARVLNIINIGLAKMQ